jgi:hypothetical protein
VAIVAAGRGQIAPVNSCRAPHASLLRPACCGRCFINIVQHRSVREEAPAKGCPYAGQQREQQQQQQQEAGSGKAHGSSSPSSPPPLKCSASWMSVTLASLATPPTVRFTCHIAMWNFSFSLHAYQVLCCRPMCNMLGYHVLVISRTERALGLPAKAYGTHGSCLTAVLARISNCCRRWLYVSEPDSQAASKAMTSRFLKHTRWTSGVMEE